MRRKSKPKLRRLSFKLVIVVVVVVAAALLVALKAYLSSSGSVAALATPSISLGNVVTVISYSQIGGFPNIFLDGAGVLWIADQASADSATVPQQLHLRSRKLTETTWTYRPQSIDLSAVTNLADGSSVSVVGRGVSMSSDQMVANLKIHTLAKGSLTWGTSTGTLTLSRKVRSGLVYFNNGISRIGNTLYSPYYASIEGTLNGNSVELAVSTDGGTTWTTQGTIFPSRQMGDNYETNTEASVMPMGSEGLMYAVTRRDLISASNTKVGTQPLGYSLSKDFGKTWTPVADVKVGGSKINPSLNMTASLKILSLGNNRFALVTGRPDNYVVVGMGDGGNIFWLTKKLVYSNYPYYPTVRRYLGSSGYMGATVTRAAVNPDDKTATMLMVFDSCAPGWGCPTGYRYTVTNKPLIMTREATFKW